jgi:cytochrome b pre-mRNA-processing protein 3
MNLAQLFKRNRRPAARPAYEAIVAAARRPVFYADFAVPDTVEGRFDMIALHGFLVMHRLKGGAGSEDFIQALVDEIFRDMDRSLREMGIGDLSVGKKVRKLAEIFYGHVDAYQKALGRPQAEQQAALEAAVRRNVFAGEGGGSLEQLALYIVTARTHLSQVDAGAIMSGDFRFPDRTP